MTDCEARPVEKLLFPRFATGDKYARLPVRVGSGEAGRQIRPSQRAMAAQDTMSSDKLRLALSTPVDFPACSSVSGGLDLASVSR